VWSRPFKISGWILVAALVCESSAIAGEGLIERVKSSTSPWTFHCDGNAIMYNKEKRSVCKGHVKISRDDLLVTCDSILFFYEDEGRLKKAFCVDHVQMKNKDGSAVSEKAEWDAISQQLILTGHPILYQNKNEIRGNVIVYDMQNDQYEVQKIRARLESAEGKNKNASSQPTVPHSSSVPQARATPSPKTAK